MIEQIFGSKTRVKLLQLFYSNPNRSFYVREITRKIDEQINSVRRELSNLLSIGIISSETTNNKLYYEVNQKYQYYGPLCEIFGGVQSKSSANEPEDLKAIGHVELALLTGRITRDDRSGADFVIVGDINQTQLAKYIEDLENKEGQEIRYVVFTPKEFDYRRQMNDRFVSSIIESKKQIIIDRKGVFSEKQNESEAENESKDKKRK